MDRAEKILLLQQLQSQGVIRELCPVANGYGGTAYWHYEILQPDRLPESLKSEYRQFGELRW